MKFHDLPNSSEYLSTIATEVRKSPYDNPGLATAWYDNTLGIVKLNGQLLDMKTKMCYVYISFYSKHHREYIMDTFRHFGKL